MHLDHCMKITRLLKTELAKCVQQMGGTHLPSWPADQPGLRLARGQGLRSSLCGYPMAHAAWLPIIYRALCTIRRSPALRY